MACRSACVHGAVALALACVAADASADQASVDKKQQVVDLSEPAAEPAPEVTAEPDSWLNAPAERRCGFAAGATFGPMLGVVSGYPNDSLKIDREPYLTETGVAGGGQGTAWIGIALTDWFTFGLGAGGGKLWSSDHVTDFWAVAFHLDAFPLFVLGGLWRELGLSLDAGLGMTDTTRAGEEEPTLIDSGGASRFGFGAFYEGIRLWKLSMGPFASYEAIWSPSARQPTAWIGWRTALYAGP